MSQVPTIASSTEIGTLGVFHLKRFWSAAIAARHCVPIERKGEDVLDKLVLNTPPEQGALTLVPGFQHRLSDWLATLGLGADPQQQDLHALGPIAIGAQAGDMVIWHHALPHGSCPNFGVRPRIVQYINMLPGWTHSRKTTRSTGSEVECEI